MAVWPNAYGYLGHLGLCVMYDCCQSTVRLKSLYYVPKACSAATWSLIAPKACSLSTPDRCPYN